ncbi:MAG: prolipoprotein diacylglyceryl transferase [Candidatus Sericytochromatia bacterium]|nr:prolipoprotein diacylglyceryl transferase [Candidatus Sericytochromatia bacterium]
MHPILFTLGNHPVTGFLFFLLLGVLGAYGAVNWAASRRGLDPKLIPWMVGATLVGGGAGTHLMSGLVYWSSLDQSSAAFRDGLSGMTDTGVFVFAEIALVLLAWRLKARPLAMLDAAAFAAATGSPIGRIGCLLAGCCYGQPTTMPWGFQYPPDHAGTLAAHGLALHPTPLYMSLGVGALWLVLLYLIRKKAPEGRILLTAWIGYAAVRVTVEFFRADVARGSWFWGTLTSYQIICLAAVALHVGIFWSIGQRRQLTLAAPHAVT